MYVDSDLPGETVQGKTAAFPIARPPDDDIYGPNGRRRAAGDPRPAVRRAGPPARPKNLSGGAGRPCWRLAKRGSPLAAPAQLLLQLYPRLRCAGRERPGFAQKSNGMDKNTIIIFTADHGELGGNHQMRGKGNCAYRQQNHLPLMIVHPAYPGGQDCQAVTSQIDLIRLCWR